jgi:hypothetical protein
MKKHDLGDQNGETDLVKLFLNDNPKNNVF